jgi:tetratricopeptide (TPR) repeat protein
MRQIASELLKYFRVLPQEFIADCPFSPYIQSILSFIRAHEPVPVDSPDASLLYQLAVCHLAIGDIFRAYNYISRVPATDSPDVCFVLGFCSFSVSRHSDALRFLTVSSGSSDPLVSFNSILAKAIIFYYKEEYDQSLSEFSRLRDLHHPTFSVLDCDFHIGVISGLSGDDAAFQQAMTALDPLSSLDTVSLQLAYASASRGEWELAGVYEGRLRAGALSYERTLLLSYVDYRKGQYSSAHTVLRRIWRNDGERNAGVWLLLGMILFRAGNRRDACTALSNANMLRPGQPLIERNLGALFELRQKWNDAEAVYRAAACSDRQTIYVRQRICQIQRVRQRPADYHPPLVGEIPVEAVLKSPAADRLALFQCTQVCFSKEKMDFLGDVEPEVSEAQLAYTIFRNVDESRLVEVRGRRLVTQAHLGICHVLSFTQ